MTVLDIRIGDAPDPRLSAREIEVLTAWLISDSKAEASRSLYLAMGTVNTHLSRIRAKYSAVGRSAPTKATLLARALQDGFIDIEDL
ncbi:LuxR family transcriptional regulator [Rhodococcoides fascians A21d2]|uniref:LuxR C-terminal-related transcriptional regulator n=1 Tax=Nocardiaceae TaxID=85025 RepID=UPI00055ECFBE|nr:MULTISPECIES: LuxR C-terminal-related transcriptional regulator [Rhodococcus]OZC45568.1 LuxR family transcriptional regulator [Rhodococcus sp. WWJCD1]QII02015.1 LuxR family transcriptional regulator [Rhodococcus fascians A21d2]